jgi:hypothetical protein
MLGGSAAASGSLTAQLIRGGIPLRTLPAVWPAKELTVRELIRHGMPGRGLDRRVNHWRARNWPNLWRGVRRVLAARSLNLPTLYGSLYISHIRADGEVLDYGLASMRVVTTAGVGFVVDAFQGSVEPEIMKYHGVGTGTNAEASGDTALQTESTTILTVDSTRATGTQTEGASANIYRSVGTVSFDGSGAITEHGLFSVASTGSGVLLDRSVFSAINVISGDSIAFTWELTIPAGS